MSAINAPARRAFWHCAHACRWPLRSIAVLALAAAATGARAECDEIRVDVMLPAEAEIDATQSARQISESVGYGAAGAVVARYHVETSACAARVTFSRLTVLVAAELTRGGQGCAFEVALEHELEHVDIYRTTPLWLPDRVRQLAERMPLPLAVEAALAELRALHAAHDAHAGIVDENADICGTPVIRRLRRSAGRV